MGTPLLKPTTSDHARQRHRLREGVISSDGAKVRILVVPTDEERNIARYTRKVLGV